MITRDPWFWSTRNQSADAICRDDCLATDDHHKPFHIPHKSVQRSQFRLN